MFKNTRSFFNKITNEVELLKNFWIYGTQVAYILYQIYTLCTANSLWYAHLVLLIVSVAYFIFYSITVNSEIEGSQKERKAQRKILKRRIRSTKKIYVYLKYVINAFILSISMYTIIVSPETVHPLNIILTSFLAVLLIVEVLLEIIVAFVKSRCDMFVEALKDDFSAPVDAVKSIFKKKESSQDSDNPPTRIYSLKRLIHEKFKKFKGNAETEDYTDKTNEEETV